MELKLDDQALTTIHALNSKTRIEIINQLAQTAMTVTELATKLHYSKAIISRHVKLLKAAQIVVERTQIEGTSVGRKLLLNAETISLVLPEKIYPSFKKSVYDIPLGNYFAVENITPQCGIISRAQIIGDLNQPDSFLLSDRLAAEALWFTQGTVEYIIPNILLTRQPEMIDISFEVASLTSDSPSFVTLWLNDTKLGDMEVTPSENHPFVAPVPEDLPSAPQPSGTLKHLRINGSDTGVDGYRLSTVNLHDLSLDRQSTLHFKLGIDTPSNQPGGLVLFGSDLGKYGQAIQVTCFYTEQLTSEGE